MTKCMLRELWNGNIAPVDKPVEPGSKYASLIDRLIEQEEWVRELLQDDAKRAFERYCDNQYDLAAVCAEDGFVDGFCLGARMMMEVLCEQ